MHNEIKDRSELEGYFNEMLGSKPGFLMSHRGGDYSDEYIKISLVDSLGNIKKEVEFLDSSVGIGMVGSSSVLDMLEANIDNVNEALKELLAEESGDNNFSGV